MIAHRGGTGLGPENTLFAYERAIATGCDYVEIDVRATADGQLILMHDSTVDRTTDGHGQVGALSYEAIRRLDAGSHDAADCAALRVPSLGEALSLCRDRIGIYLDHKSGAVDDILAEIDHHQMRKHIIVYLNNLDDALEWRQRAPEIPLMISLPDAYTRLGGIADLLDRLRPAILDGGALDWSRELVEEAHAHDLAVYVDNLGVADSPNGWQHSLDIGVGGIQTDSPNQLLAWLQAQQGR